MTDSPLLLRRETNPAIATITLNRPNRINAVSKAMWVGLGEMMRGLGADRSVRVIILTGAKGNFCAGADISEFDTERNSVEQGKIYEDAVNGCVHAILETPQPTIAAISGYCVGGGFGLAQACDFRIADRSGKFGIPAAKLGVVYDRLECQNLLSVVGLSRAKEILFTGERMGAEEAHRIGFVTRIVDEDPVAAAHEFAGRMTGNAPLSIAGMKLILNALAAGEGDRNEEAFDAAMTRALSSEDYREGVRAFSEKRQPQFRGE